MREAPKSSSPDHLTTTTEGNSIELTEEELKRVAGGVSQDKITPSANVHGGWDVVANRKV